MAKTDEKSLEQIQREIAEVELQTGQLNLAEARKRNETFLAAEEARRRGNRQRQAELKQGREGREAIVTECRHKSGGSPNNILHGGGIGSFSVISRAIMPDGVTRLLQCPRCRMREYFRPLTRQEEVKLKKNDSEKVERYLQLKDLFETSKDLGLEHGELRGPTFFFQNEAGVPVIPEMR